MDKIKNHSSKEKFEIPIVDGAISKWNQPFHFSSFRHIQNWIALITEWNAAGFPKHRQFWRPTGTLGYYFLPTDLKPGDFIESASDEKYPKATLLHRRLFRVLEIHPTYLLIEEGK